MVQLFYGGLAKSRSKEEALRFGKILNAESDGLTKDEAAWVVDKCRIMYPHPVSFHLGPFDTIRPTSSDALLKTLEEHDSSIGFFLYAEDIQNVSGTIVSRSFPTYCPEPRRDAPQSPILSMIGNPVSLSVWLKGKSDEDVRKAVELLAGTEHWEKVRSLLKRPLVCASHVVAALL